MIKRFLCLAIFLLTSSGCGEVNDSFDTITTSQVNTVTLGGPGASINGCVGPSGEAIDCGDFAAADDAFPDVGLITRRRRANQLTGNSCSPSGDVATSLLEETCENALFSGQHACPTGLLVGFQISSRCRWSSTHGSFRVSVFCTAHVACPK